MCVVKFIPKYLYFLHYCSKSLKFYFSKYLLLSLEILLVIYVYFVSYVFPKFTFIASFLLLIF